MGDPRAPPAGPTLLPSRETRRAAKRVTRGCFSSVARASLGRVTLLPLPQSSSAGRTLTSASVLSRFVRCGNAVRLWVANRWRRAMGDETTQSASGGPGASGRCQGARRRRPLGRDRRQRDVGSLSGGHRPNVEALDLARDHLQPGGGRRRRPVPGPDPAIPGTGSCSSSTKRTWRAGGLGPRPSRTQCSDRRRDRERS